MSTNALGLSLSDLLQISALGRRTCHVHVTDGRTGGELFLEQGRIVHATFAKQKGEAAVLAMLASAEVYVRVDHKAAPARHTLDRDAQELVLEAARRQDEARMSEDAVPVPPVQRDWRGLYAVLVCAIVIGAGIVGTQWRRGGHAIAAAAVAGSAPADEPPRLLEAPKPVRPRVDLAIAPTIVCRLLVDAEGKVADRRVYRSRLDLEAFEEAALDAAARFRFAPARHAGAPVAAWINVPVAFDAGGAAVRIKGSDTIGGALGPALAHAFEAQHADSHVTVEALGSATAFVGLFDGSADIGASSRPADTHELDRARALGITLEENVIGYDGVAVIVNPRNAIPQLTIEELSRLYGGEARWPDSRPVHLIGRPSYSGTHAFFKERVLRRGAKDGQEEFAAGVRVLERNEDILAAVAADPDAIAYVGLGWLGTGVRAVPISPGAGQRAVEPAAASVRDGSYPLYRPLLLYTRGAPHGETARVLQFALSPEGQALVAGNGFVPSDVPAKIASGEPQEAELAMPPVRLFFATSRVTLDDEARHTLQSVATRLARGHERALVVGHADADGRSDGNRHLARSRAERVAAFLEQAGAPKDAVAIDGESSDHPVASNATAEGRRQNRRVDVFLVAR